MSKIKFGLALIMGVLLAATALGQSFTATPNAAITSGATTTSSINVPAGTTINDVVVAVSISHSHGGDLTIGLQHQGTSGDQTIDLLRGLNTAQYLHGCGADAINATFSDGAGVAMDNFDCASNFNQPVTGVWRPSDALGSFAGRDAGGTWTLIINDRLASDDGVLQSWSIAFNTTENPAPGGGDIGGGLPVIGGQVAQLCSDLDGSTTSTVRAVFPNGDNDLYCRIIAENSNYVSQNAEIGDAGVVSKGVIQAVDVFSLVGSADPRGAQVCLEGGGSLIFMDSANAPRIPEWVPAYVRGSYTCGRVNNTGTMILVERGPDGTTAVNAAEDVVEETASTTANTEAIGATFADTVWSGTALTDCDVTTTAMLNIRTQSSIAGRVITQVPFGLTLEAVAVEGDWFRVIYLDGQGWLNKEYLDISGDC